MSNGQSNQAVERSFKLLLFFLADVAQTPPELMVDCSALSKFQKKPPKN